MTLAGAFSATVGAFKAMLLDTATRPAVRRRNPSPIARGAITSALRRTRLPGALSRARAAELLGASGDAAALPALSRLLSDRHADVRAAAVRALGKLGNPDAMPALLEALEGPQSVPEPVVTVALLEIGLATTPGLDFGALYDGPPTPRAPKKAAPVAGFPRGRLGA
jgi:hypothetical protein